MKRLSASRLVTLILAFAVVCSACGGTVLAAEEQKTVSVQVSGMFEGVNHWSNATYTYTVTDGAVSDHGILSNGNYSFLYYPDTGQIKNAAQATSFSYVNGMTDAACPDIVIPVSIEAFSNEELSYPASAITMSAQTTNYAIFRYDTSIANARIIIPEGVTELPNNVFGQMAGTNKGTRVVLPSTLKSIGQNTFAMSSGGGMYHEFDLPDGLEFLGPSCFQNCRFERIEVPSGVTAINASTFAFMKASLKEVVFHGDVTSIGATAFKEDNSLQKLTFYGKEAPAINATAFQNVKLSSTLTVYYPANGAGYQAESFAGLFPEGTVFEALPGVPAASNIVITGQNIVGHSMYASYTYTDPSNREESGSVGVWSRADDAVFTTGVETVKTERVAAEVPASYTLTDEDNGKYIRFAVTPKNADITLNTGDEASAVFPDPIRLPQTKPVVVLTAPADGSRIMRDEPVTLKATAVCDDTTITVVEFYADDVKIAQAEAEPYEVQWIPAKAGNYTITAKAVNALAETAVSAGAGIQVLEPGEHLDPVWAQKWQYDFSDFTDTQEYQGSIILPGKQPPTVGSFNGIITSGHGEYGKSSDDYYLKLVSPSDSNEAARIYFPLDQLDAPVKNIVARAKVAFTTKTETRYILSYRTSKSAYEGFYFNNNGTIGYQDANGRTTFKDENGADLIYTEGKWYETAIKFDFENKTISYYLDGKPLLTTTPQDVNSFTGTTEVSVKGVVNKSEPGALLLDDLFLGQEQESYVTAVLSSDAGRTVLTGETVRFTGYAKDALNGGIDTIEILDNNERIKIIDAASFEFALSDLAPGSHKIVAKATSASGERGYSQPITLTVSGIALPSMYADGMLFQREKEIRISGRGNNGTKVRLWLNGAQAETIVENGAWAVSLPPQPANQGTTLHITVNDGVEMIYQNVAIGELILCAGQSNMAYALEKFSSLSVEADQDYPDIRLFKQEERIANARQQDIPSGYWVEATAEAATSFSGVGFAVGKKYYMSQNGEVPVGLIYAAKGGSSINMWVTPDAFDFDPDLVGMKAASTHYNAMVAPWNNFNIGHVIWYQGEANTMLSQQYEKALTAYIDGYREAWGDHSLNFIIVQLPVYDYPNKYTPANRTAVGVREGQFNVSQRLERVATVVTIDTGEANNIHPNDKQALAERCVLALRHFIEPENTAIQWKSPSYSGFMLEEDRMVIAFQDAGAGLKTADGEAPRGFKIAGEDGRFVDADAAVSGNTVIIDTKNVKGTPKVRYAFQDVVKTDDGAIVVPNLVNSANLPAAPFRTDQDRYHRKFENGAFTTPYNYVPMIRDITAGRMPDGNAEIMVSVRDYDDSVAKVELYADGELLGEAKGITDTEFSFTWNSAPEGSHTFYAIAADSTGAVSIQQDSSFGSRTVTPKNFMIRLPKEDDGILHFEDLAGSRIQNFEGKDGVKVLSALDTGAVLVIACYSADDRLVDLKTVQGGSISFSAEELAESVRVRAFLFEDLTSIRPVASDISISRSGA